MALYFASGFSDLMKTSPDQMVPALLIHNNLITKAKWDNFGSTIEQEGGEFCGHPSGSWNSL